MSFGRRATDWELKGVPVRLELGPRDLADGVVTLVRRIIGGDARRRCRSTASPTAVAAALDAEQAALLDRGDRRVRESRTADVATLDDAREAADDRLGAHPVGHRRRRGRGRARAERRHRALPASAPTARCPTSDDEPDLVAVVARSY